MQEHWMHRQQTNMTRLATAALILIGLTAPAQAKDDVQDQIIAQLRAQGYTSFEVSTTLLGRLRILAQQGGTNREIVVNPRTGEVLRDVNLLAAPQSGGSGNSGSGGGSGAQVPPPLREEDRSGKGGDRSRDQESGSNSGSGSSGGGSSGSGSSGSGSSGGGSSDDDGPDDHSGGSDSEDKSGGDSKDD
jgi:hypothetical protein